jgi:hypothetical protein
MLQDYWPTAIGSSGSVVWARLIAEGEEAGSAGREALIERLRAWFFKESGRGRPASWTVERARVATGWVVADLLEARTRDRADFVALPGKFLDEFAVGMTHVINRDDALHFVEDWIQRRRRTAKLLTIDEELAGFVERSAQRIPIQRGPIERGDVINSANRCLLVHARMRELPERPTHLMRFVELLIRQSFQRQRKRWQRSTVDPEILAACVLDHRDGTPDNLLDTVQEVADHLFKLHEAGDQGRGLSLVEYVAFFDYFLARGLSPTTAQTADSLGVSLQWVRRARGSARAKIEAELEQRGINLGTRGTPSESGRESAS